MATQQGTTTHTGTMRDHKRRAVQDAVARVAIDLFAARGYEATTVEQVASCAGLSPRSFFRYFTSKDAVLTHAFDSTGADIAETLGTRPAAEDPWTSLRRAFDPLISEMLGHEPTLPIMRMIYETPTLCASHLQKQGRWREMLADVLAPRLKGHPAPSGRSNASRLEQELRVRASSLAGAAIACLEAARMEWVASDGSASLPALLDSAMNAVAPLRDEAAGRRFKGAARSA